MKKNNFLVLVSLLMAFAFGVMSCNKNDDDENDEADLSKEIVGIWDITSKDYFIDGKKSETGDYYHYTPSWSMSDGGNNDVPSIKITKNEWYFDFKDNGYFQYSKILKYEYETLNGSGSSSMEDNAGGKYSISGNKLTLTKLDDDGKETNEVSIAEISISGNTITIKTEEKEEKLEDEQMHKTYNIFTATKR